MPGAWLPGASLTKLGACAAPPGPSRRPGWARTPTRACSWPGAHLLMTPPGLREGNAALRAGRGLRGGEDLARLGRGFRFLGRFSPTSPHAHSLRVVAVRPGPWGALKRSAWRFAQTASDPRGCRPASPLRPPPAPAASSAFHVPPKASSLPGPVPSGRSPVDVYPPSWPFFLTAMPPAPSTYPRTEIGQWGKVAGAAAFPESPRGREASRDFLPDRWGYILGSEGAGTSEVCRMQRYWESVVLPRGLGRPVKWLCPQEAIPSRFFPKSDLTLLGQDLWKWRWGRAGPASRSRLTVLGAGGGTQGPSQEVRRAHGRGFTAQLMAPTGSRYPAGFSWQIGLTFLL